MKTQFAVFTSRIVGKHVLQQLKFSLALQNHAYTEHSAKQRNTTSEIHILLLLVSKSYAQSQTSPCAVSGILSVDQLQS